MKKIISILGTICLTVASTTSLVACKKSQEKENNVNWKEECSQDEPFNVVDNKWYFVVWHGTNTDIWQITFFQNINYLDKIKVLDSKGNYELALKRADGELFINKLYSISNFISWSTDNGTYFKSVYRWDGVGKPWIPVINIITGEVFWEKIKPTPIFDSKSYLKWLIPVILCSILIIGTGTIWYIIKSKKRIK